MELHSRPRILGMASQRTSYWRKRWATWGLEKWPFVPTNGGIFGAKKLRM